MRTEARLVMSLAVFFWLAAIAFGIWSSNTLLHVEVVGVAALILTGGLVGIPGTFFWFVSRRIDLRPEDRGDAEIAEAAGDFGFFSPGSYWPVTLAGAATVVGLALAFAQVWLLIVAVLFLLFAIGGLLFEYYLGGNRPLTERVHD